MIHKTMTRLPIARTMQPLHSIMTLGLLKCFSILFLLFVTSKSHIVLHDEYYEEDIATRHQFRACIDLRPYCAEIRHRCSIREDQLWMHSHCPLTCDVCHTIITYDVSFEDSFTAVVFSALDVRKIRDAMGGYPMGVPQYLSTTTSAFRNDITRENRTAMIRHIQQSKDYFDNHQWNISMQCQNKSPYCTIWAVLHDRCNDAFYDQVMLEHCPVACRRCHSDMDDEPSEDPSSTASDEP